MYDITLIYLLRIKKYPSKGEKDIKIFEKEFSINRDDDGIPFQRQTFVNCVHRMEDDSALN